LGPLALSTQADNSNAPTHTMNVRLMKLLDGVLAPMAGDRLEGGQVPAPGGLLALTGVSQVGRFVSFGCDDTLAPR
jgi:hypothetical protein